MAEVSVSDRDKAGAAKPSVEGSLKLTKKGWTSEVGSVAHFQSSSLQIKIKRNTIHNRSKKKKKYR